jgi:hypothetical protein
MKRTALILASIQLALWCIAPLLLAAPTPIAGPVDIEGTIAEVQWLPEKEVKATPQMTGSAGVDRKIPARFMVSLINYTGLDADTVEKMKIFYQWSIPKHTDRPGMPELIVLRLTHTDRTFLKSGMKIRVKGYRIAGDEGGDYPSYNKLQILPGKNNREPQK